MSPHARMWFLTDLFSYLFLLSRRRSYLELLFTFQLLLISNGCQCNYCWRWPSSHGIFQITILRAGDYIVWYVVWCFMVFYPTSLFGPHRKSNKKGPKIRFITAKDVFMNKTASHKHVNETECLTLFSTLSGYGMRLQLFYLYESFHSSLFPVLKLIIFNSDI